MTEKKMNVESFNLDHTKVVAPYIRLVGVYSGIMEIKYINMILDFANQIKNT